ncbi:MAG: ABC transporter permease subunit [Agathobacter sp.]|nr:ABC transporter permease subunit [Agathobacter sp.]
MQTLIRYEVNKILRKKSTIVVFLILFLLHIVFVAISGSLGSTYVDDKLYETHYERNQIDRVYGLELSGRKIDDTLLTEMKGAYAKIDKSTSAYLWSDIYKNEVRKYSDIDELFGRYWPVNLGFLHGRFDEKISAEKDLYSVREDYKQQAYTDYALSEDEQAYWEKKESKIEVPFTYQYHAAYRSILGGQGLYMICMFITFFIAVTMVNVFFDEHSRKTDQLILCTRLGHGKLYTAKILAGSLVTFFVSLLFVITAILGKFFSYGPEGFEASIQMLVYWYPYPLSVGETSLIMIVLLLLSSIMVTIFAMILAEILKNNIGAIAIISGIFFASRLVVIPMQYEFLSHAWKFLPINMLMLNDGFVDLRLMSFFGVKLTNWQFAPILYVALSVFMFFVGSRVYRNYQVSGR